ncbi:MAG TPA: aminopeptidase [Anaerolineales bacterium]|nr:aminopeptidase [Anaerolineales bacterium]
MNETFQTSLEKYADIIVNIGLNLHKEQRLNIAAGLPDAELVRLVAKKAYQLGSPFVDVRWIDERLTRIRFENSKPEHLVEVPQWQIDREHEYGSRGDALLSFASQDPNLLEGISPDLIGRYRKAISEKYEPVAKYRNENTQTWCVVSTATPAWAQKVFPSLPVEQAQEKLWEAIFDACRVNTVDPVQAWREHAQKLHRQCDYLNEKRYAGLHYKAPGTDLTLGLPDNHLWIGASGKTQNGIEYIPNLPTEEVFSMPHREKTEGYVTSSRPLILSGTMIDEFTLTFENGRVNKVTAKQGEENIHKLLETDENASRFGEAALVPDSSPISQRKHLFYNTLFDENASSHLALGTAYRYNVKGGTSMTKEEFIAAGGNDSLIHVDFMIGSDQMDIDGIRADGTREAVMRKGEWAF